MTNFILRHDFRQTPRMTEKDWKANIGMMICGLAELSELDPNLQTNREKIQEYLDGITEYFDLLYGNVEH